MSIPDARSAAADMLTGFLKMEEGHIDWAEIQHSQIEQMGLENYLANQTQGASKQALYQPYEGSMTVPAGE